MKERANNNGYREWAKLLYTQHNSSVRDIALETSVDESSIRNWLREGGWDGLKSSLLISKRTQLRHLYNLLDTLNNKMTGDGYEAIAKDVDQYLKYTNAIKNLEGETTIATIIEVGGMFVKWQRRVDLTLAQKITANFDAFVEHKQSPLGA